MSVLPHIIGKSRYRIRHIVCEPIGDCVDYGALGIYLLLLKAQHRALAHEQPHLIGRAACHDGYVLRIALLVQLDGRLREHLSSVTGAGCELADRFNIRLPTESYSVFHSLHLLSRSLDVL